MELIVEVISMKIDSFFVFKDDEIWRACQIDEPCDRWKSLFDLWDIIFKSFVANLMEKTRECLGSTQIGRSIDRDPGLRQESRTFEFFIDFFIPHSPKSFSNFYTKFRIMETEIYIN